MYVPYAVDRPDETGFRLYSLDERGTSQDVINMNSRVVVCRTSDDEAKTFHLKRAQGEMGENENRRILPKFPKSIGIDKSDSANFRKILSRFSRPKKRGKFRFRKQYRLGGGRVCAADKTKQIFTENTTRIHAEHTTCSVRGNDHNKICTFVAKELVSSTRYLCTRTKSVQRD